MNVSHHSKNLPAGTAQSVSTKKCPFCAEEILAAAKKCKHCKEILDDGIREQKKVQFVYQQQSNPGVAAVLSFFIPGLGQMYRGQIMEGIFWLIFVVIGYALFILPGLILHIFCIVKAYNSE